MKYNTTSFTEPYFFLDNLEPDVVLKIVIYAVNSKGRSKEETIEEVVLKDLKKTTGKFDIIDIVVKKTNCFQ